LNFGMAFDEGADDIRLAIRLLDQHIDVLTAKLRYLTSLTEDEHTAPFSWSNISNCKRELDQAAETKRRLMRDGGLHLSEDLLPPSSSYHN